MAFPTSTHSGHATHDVAYDEAVIDTVPAPDAQAPPSQRFEGLSRLLRGVGALALLAAASSFLLQHWESGGDVWRYYALLAHTGLLGVLGFAWGLRAGDAKGARTFLALAAGLVPAHFSILGGLVYSQFSLDGPLAAVASYATWVAPDATTATLAVAATAVALGGRDGGGVRGPRTSACRPLRCSLPGGERPAAGPDARSVDDRVVRRRADRGAGRARAAGGAAGAQPTDPRRRLRAHDVVGPGRADDGPQRAALRPVGLLLRGDLRCRGGLRDRAGRRATRARPLPRGSAGRGPGGRSAAPAASRSSPWVGRPRCPTARCCPSAASSSRAAPRRSRSRRDARSGATSTGGWRPGCCWRRWPSTCGSSRGSWRRSPAW